ncbi:alpha-N-arabinofuranosidase A [Colletotrichum truncatum]|uniref:Alpha-N-arabinofuranosidase A n=1 Tax=Colletotrichum truncatum TaxID=5467 RepID=A0ACC3ZGS0_COLTU|nr:alpha-N-arabinofuranosidase A [Colletotrichum truncatum]KAF6790433.1 alpha-N-arabinofuranosidase A [Colletotrichum truncatum]
MHLTRLLLSAAVATAITVQVSKDGGKEAASLQYGLMFEDINYSGDGGLYAELIRNRAFQGDKFMESTLFPWEPVGTATIALSHDSLPVSPALPVSVSVTGKAGEVIGLSNPGYWGIDVKPQTYTGTFWVLGDFKGNFTAALRSSETGETYASTEIPSNSNSDEWTEHEFKLNPEVAAGHETNFTLTYTLERDEQALHFNLISLFPPTYNDRPNGLRIDLMETLKELKPGFIRLPGGNNLQGSQPGSHWKWNQTLGDLVDRPGRMGAWRYFNTDGLGLIEYMQWCDDLGAEPILIVFAGLYLGGSVIPEDELHVYIDDALNEIEFLTGDASTEYGAKRAALGYEKPWKLRFVGVGNEDHFSSGMASYNAYRFRMFFDAISERYPDLTILSSTVELDPIPDGAALDYHDYGNPDGAVRNFTLFDNYTLDHKILVGEYGVARDNGNEVLWSNHRLRPWWIASVAEAIFYIGTERNPDKVYGAAFAPLLQNINEFQWRPNMISFNANTSATVRSTSFHVMSLFSQHRLTKVLDVKNSENYGPGYWVAGVNEDANTYVWKGAVYNSTDDQAFNVVFPDANKGSKASLTVLTAPDAFSQNFFDGPDVVQKELLELEAGRNGFEFTLPQWSVAVLEWKAKN